MASLPAMPVSCVLDLLDVGHIGVCEIQTKLTEDFTLIVTSNIENVKDDYQQVFGCMPEMVEKLPVSDKNYRPINGFLVAVNTLDGWQRGYVISVLDEYTSRVALCDSCCVQTVQNVNLKTLPLQFTTVPQFGVRASINNSLHPAKAELLQPGLRFKFRITWQSKNIATAELKCKSHDDLSLDVTLVPWVPKYEDKGLKCIKLINKSEVQIVSYCSQHDIFLCPMDDDNVELRHRVLHDVATYCQEVPDLDYLPDPGELVACRFTSDEIYYRAQVVTCEGERVQVVYVDFGNVEYTTLDRLKPLTDNFKQIPCTAVHIKLKDVMEGPLTMPAINFFDVMIMSDAKMIVTFTDSYTKDGVTLISKNNENVNKIIDNCLTPYWKLAIAAGNEPSGDEVFTAANDMEFLNLPESQTFQLFVLHKEQCNTFFYGCAIDFASTYGLKTLPKEIALYCDALKADCYTPRPEELCLAMCGDEWLRAVCLLVEQVGCAVYFMDWGNTEILSTSFIRRMPKDFSSFPSIANICFIHGLPENLSDDFRNRLDELVPLYSVHSVKVISRKGDKYYLDMPDVMASLRTEGYL